MNVVQLVRQVITTSGANGSAFFCSFHLADSQERVASAPSQCDIFAPLIRPKRETRQEAIPKFAVEWNPYLCNNQRTK